MDYYAKLHGTLHDQGFPPEWRGKAGILPIPQNFKPPSVGCSHLFCPSTKKFRLFASCPPLSFLWSWTKYQTRYFWMTQLKLSFTNIMPFCLNFLDCESFLESISPDILALCETDLVCETNYVSQLILAMTLWWLPSFNLKENYLPLICSLCERGVSFFMELIFEKLYEFVCFWLDLLYSVSNFFFFCW